ncbi:uncharacterized protein LOC100902250 [Galendromus occidentalis]|uniref:Uncharacterized protein LOC100902250 n=1 Tax=Galendromus occidentalis TaxID=34638 RepID=A0AAJ6QN31_9ACAR|nr:uncharacterized protein LOC100902250 [Galendromus occidentalis]
MDDPSGSHRVGESIELQIRPVTQDKTDDLQSGEEISCDIRKQEPGASEEERAPGAGARLEEYKSKPLFRTYFLEFVMAFYTLGIVIYGIPLSSLMFEKNCLYAAGLNASVCSDLEAQEGHIKNPILGQASFYSTLRDVVQNVPAALAAVIIGNYLTRYGFRTPLLVTLVGGFLTSFCHLLTAFYMPAPLIFNALADLPGSFAGGSIVISTAVYTNIALRVPESLRLFRMTAMSLCMGIPAFIAVSSGATLSAMFGIKVLLSFSAMILTIPTVLVIFFLEDIDTPKENKDDTWREAIWLSLKNGLKTSINAISLERPDRKRTQIIIMMICIATSSIGMQAKSGSLAYAHLKSVLKFKESDYAKYATIAMILGIGCLFPLVALSKKLKLSAPLMVCFGMACTVAKFVMLALTEFSENLFYIQIFVSIPYSLSPLSARSHLTGLVEKSEVSVVMSLSALIEKLVPLLSGPLSTYVFTMTSSYFPGCYYLMIGGAYIIPLGLSLYCAWIIRGNRRKEGACTHL